MTADEFCSGVDYDICAVLNGSDQIRCTEGVVDNERQTVSVSDLGERVNVGDVAVGVAKSLDVDRLGVRLNRCLDLVEVVDVNEGCINAVERKSVRQQVSRAAVDRFLRYDMLAFGCKSLNGVGDRSRAGSESQACYAALECRDSFLKNSLRGVCKSAVDVACVGKSETVCGVLSVMEYI